MEIAKRPSLFQINPTGKILARKECEFGLHAGLLGGARGSLAHGKGLVCVHSRLVTPYVE